MSAAEVGMERPLPRRLNQNERLAASVVLAAVFHVVLLFLLEFAVRIPWPQPRTYLGSVTVELEVAESKPVAEPPTVVEPPTAATQAPRSALVPQPKAQTTPKTAASTAPATPAVRTPAAAPQSAEPKTASPKPEPAAAAVDSRTAAATATSPSAAAPSATKTSGGVVGARPTAPSARADAVSSVGADRPAVAVSEAPLGAQASREALPPAEVAAPFDPFGRTTETRQLQASRASEPATPLAQSRGGAQGSTVGSAGRAAEAESLMNRLDRIGSGTSSPSGAEGSSRSAAAGSGGAFPLVDPTGRYQVRNPELERGGRGLLTYVEPDLTGVEPASSRMIVEVKILVASSGEVMDPRISRHATSPLVDARILQAVRRWQFTPASSSAAMIEAVVTFTIVPKS